MQTAEHPGRSPRTTLVIILILGALSTVMPLSIDMYLPTFPQIAERLHRSVPEISWSLSGFFIGVAVGQLFYGPLLDRFGRKPPLYVGLAVYVLGSVGCLLSGSLNMLIAFRLIQALGSCVAGVASMAMVRDFFHPREGAKVFSLLMLILGVSPLFAPTIGGVVAQTLGWQWVFIVLALVAVAIAASIYLFLPDGHTGDASISLKPWPILKSFAAICRHPQFYTYALSGAFSLGGIFAYVAGSPILFMNVFHLSPQTYSLVFAGLSIGFIGASQVNIALSKRFGSNTVFKVSIKVQAVVGLVFLVGTANGWYGLGLTIFTLFLFLCCIGFTYPNAAAMALAPFHSEKAGRASALLGSSQVGVGALASAVVGSFSTHHGLPAIAVIAATSWLGLLALLIGRRKIHKEVHSAHENETTMI